MGVTTLDRGYLPWMGGAYLGQGVPTTEGVPTLDVEYLPLTEVPTLDWGVSTLGIPPPPPIRLDGVPPCQAGWGITCQAGWVYPPQLTGQHSEYLLRGGWYASCVHAEGISC